MPPDFVEMRMTWKGKNMKKTTLLLWGMLMCIGVFSQSVTGIITDEKGAALASAHIAISNQNLSIITNAQGYFVFEDLSPADYTLQISFMGKQTINHKIVLTQGPDIDLGTIILYDIQFSTGEIVVTATKTPRLLNSIPASMVYVSKFEMKAIAAKKVDVNLKTSNGIFVNRPFGIFGKSVVGMRGVVSSEPGRQLTLIDGVPINKSDGGGVNWNRIINLDIDHIEVVKGPGSSIYGSHAMGGTINLITKRPKKKGIGGIANINYGSYNTVSGAFSFMHRLNDTANSFYYALAARVLKSDGYMTVPDSIREASDTAVFLNEKAANIRLGYLFSENSLVEMEYNYYNDHRGQGTKIRLPDGETADYDTHFFKSKLRHSFSGFQLDVNAFYQLEAYQRQIEKIKKGNYSLVHVNSDRVDYGVLTSLNRSFGTQSWSLGFDFRNGSVNGVDSYQTSSDKVINRGKMNHFNVYLQDEISFTDRFRSIAAIQMAYIKFYEGAFLVEDPTSATDFMGPFTGDLDEKAWQGWSPSLSFQYDISDAVNVYTVASRGFRAAALDDLSRTGFINIGYKLANPLLKPEVINSIELGSRFRYSKLLFTANAYYSQGKDFMYYVATGESLFGGRKKIYQKENISLVEIYGLEAELQYHLSNSLQFKLNYTHNQSTIKEFEERPELQTKKLTYTPNNLANFTTILNYRKWTSSLTIHGQDKMYLDEQNTFVVEALLGVDIHIAYQFYKGFSVAASLDNIFDEQHMVSSDQVSLGRYVSATLSYGF